jgi:3-phosphoglycerate kinase
MKFHSLDHFDFRGKTVLVRLDLNCPLKNGKVFDDTRIRASLPVLEHLLSQTSRVIVMSHLGRPKEGDTKTLSLAPVGEVLASHLKREVILIDSYKEDGIKQILNELGQGLFLLENLRFHPEEKANEHEFAAKLAEGMDFYVNDAFGACHRLHTSVVELAKQFPFDRKSCWSSYSKRSKAL